MRKIKEREQWEGIEKESVLDELEKPDIQDKIMRIRIKQALKRDNKEWQLYEAYVFTQDEVVTRKLNEKIDEIMQVLKETRKTIADCERIIKTYYDAHQSISDAIRRKAEEAGIELGEQFDIEANDR